MPDPPLTRSLILLLSALLPAGCGSDAGAGRGEPPTLALGEAEVRIGSVDGPVALERVADATVGPDGRLYLIQPTAAEVRVFEADGSPAATIGRRGEGPGELLLPSALGFFRDTLWVMDRRLGRLALYAPDGASLGERPLPEAPPVADGVAGSIAGFAPGGGALFTTYPGFQSGLAGTREPFPLLRRSPDGAVDTLAALDMAHRQMVFIGTDGSGAISSVEIVTQPYTDVALWHLSPRAGRLAVVERPVAEVADSASYRLTTVDLRGDTLYSVALAYRPRPVDARAVDSLLTRFRRGGRTEAAVREQMFLPDFEAEVEDIVVAADGRVWVARTAIGDMPTAWDVFTPDGRLAARVEAPVSLDLFHADGAVLWGIHTDELDVPYVLRFAVPAGIE